MTATIGCASTIRPTVAGTFSSSINEIAPASVERMRAKLPSATNRDTAGVDAAAIDTPNRPIGRYISRNARSR